MSPAASAAFETACDAVMMLVGTGLIAFAFFWLLGAVIGDDC